ncbi:hypothetical protein GCM10009647_070680 [Streptomyces sanglieri]|uniref:Uncharacterized protein n=1 Tax=Streptomyces sanglieri TaxID=193460 RepID=A0ABW2WNK5_9ACTN|nr:hypothetical protein [Streptomyces sp. Wh19]MDV9195866.1 hypothetical protein [Streptomyces sp. Wh19]
MTSEDEVANGWFRAVALPEGGAEVEGGDAPSVPPGGVSVAVAVLPVVAGGALVAVPPGSAGAVEVPEEEEGALVDASGIAGGAEVGRLVVGWGPGWLGSTRVA